MRPNKTLHILYMNNQMCLVKLQCQGQGGERGEGLTLVHSLDVGHTFSQHTGDQVQMLKHTSNNSYH